MQTAIAKTQSVLKQWFAKAREQVVKKRLEESFKELVDTANKLIEDISNALQSVGNFGSVEIYIQKGSVSQITFRKIIKTTRKKG